MRLDLMMDPADFYVKGAIFLVHMDEISIRGRFLAIRSLHNVAIWVLCSLIVVEFP